MMTIGHCCSPQNTAIAREAIVAIITYNITNTKSKDVATLICVTRGGAENGNLFGRPRHRGSAQTMSRAAIVAVLAKVKIFAACEFIFFFFPHVSR
jgi:hypothetical protein